jgi:hypothetical protein
MDWLVLHSPRHGPGTFCWTELCLRYYGGRGEGLGAGELTATDSRDSAKFHERDTLAFEGRTTSGRGGRHGAVQTGAAACPDHAPAASRPSPSPSSSCSPPSPLPLIARKERSQSLHTDQGSSDSATLSRGGVSRCFRSRNPSIQIRAVPTNDLLPTILRLQESRNPSIQIRAVPTEVTQRGSTIDSQSQSLHTDQGSSDGHGAGRSSSSCTCVAIPPYRSGQFRRGGSRRDSPRY